MRTSVLRFYGAELILIALVGCGDTTATGHQENNTATGNPARESGPLGANADAGIPRTSIPVSGAIAPIDASAPGREPVDAGRARVGATDAGKERTLDAGAAAQPALDAGHDAGARTSAADDAGTGTKPPEPARLPPVTSVAMDGPFATAVDMNAGPGRAGVLVRPSMLGAVGANAFKHPIFIWGPGRGTRVLDYESLMRRIASHGFVVYSEISQAADGTEMIAAMDWLIAENKRPDSPYYQKLDETRIGVGGHSYGSNSAMTASSDPRVKAFVHTAGSGFRGAGKALNLRQPAAFICGEDDPTANVTDCRTDYMQTSSPVFFTIIAGEDHLSTPMAGLPLVVAWLRWHLGDEAERMKMFIGPDCDFCTGIYTSQSKNWN